MHLLAVVAALVVTAPSVEAIPGQAPRGTLEIHGVEAGPFDPALWQAGRLHLLPDRRHPLLEPRQAGVFRNIYAPSPVRIDGGWRLFYGAWDGVDTGNDRIYAVDTADFVDFGPRTTVIEHGDFIHVCNVNAHRRGEGFEIVCTVYPDARGMNKPGYFSSPDGRVWNGHEAPYPARTSDIVQVEGYEVYDDADINGINVILRDGDTLRLYFKNFKDFGHVYRASGTDGIHYTYEQPVLATDHMINDLRRLHAPDGSVWYLMGLHQNGDRLWYTLSQDPLQFPPEQELAQNLGDEDRYIVAIGWVLHDDRVLGALYGAGAVRTLDRNRIFARWLQRKVVFVAEDGTRYEPDAALGPDRQIIPLPVGEPVRGRFEIYAEDGATLVSEAPAEAVAGRVYRLSLNNPGPDGRKNNPNPGAGEEAKLKPLEDGRGYSVEGPHGLTGTLRKESGSSEWKLEAQFTFPTAGYTVGKPVVRIAKSLPEKVSILLPVTPPAKDAAVAQVVTEVPVEASIPAHDRARFTVAVVSK